MAVSSLVVVVEEGLALLPSKMAAFLRIGRGKTCPTFCTDWDLSCPQLLQLLAVWNGSLEIDPSTPTTLVLALFFGWFFLHGIHSFNYITSNYVLMS